jgi:DNA-binding transcriptional ArsR family regulator
VDDEEAERVDRVFAALGDATRRDILRRAALGEHSVSALARHYAMSLAAVQKHVAVLERATLVTKRRRGREQLVRTDVANRARGPPSARDPRVAVSRPARPLRRGPRRPTGGAGPMTVISVVPDQQAHNG